MSRLEKDLAAARAARDAAQAELTARLGQARAAVHPARLAGRLKREAGARAQDIAGQALEIATDHRGILVATVSATLMWLGRKQIGKLATRHLPVERYAALAKSLGPQALQGARGKRLARQVSLWGPRAWRLWKRLRLPGAR
ncbi:MAG TPA: hypothetical protein VFF98_06620 [Novosphingobium sp.]|nr:hypothetical protein [Novosphingobium sp.]